MLLWIAFAFLTAAVLAAVLAPLVRPMREAEAAARVEGGATAVYRDQLREIDADQARGVLSGEEAEAARLEVSRRLLSSAAQPDPATQTRSVRHAPGGSLALATAAGMVLVTVAFYLAHGSPGIPASPFAERKDAAAEQAALAAVIAQVEARLRENPDQGKGWEAIAPVYLKLGRYRDAANAYANAVRLNGETVALLAGQAESAMLAADGIVTEEARTAFEKILKLEPGRPEARFWLAMAREQDGHLTEALAEYRSILEGAPSDARYRAALETRIRQVEARLAAPDADAPSGPSAADVAAAAKLSPEQRAQMIAQMVDGLAQRLKENGRDLAGWLRLLNAYAVLDRKDDARAALAEARRNFDGDATALAELSKAAARLGLGS